MKCKSVFLAGIALLLGAAFSSSYAQYPNRPVRFIVPFPPGGTADGVARIIAQQLTQTMGQQWLVDNRGGADGILAANIVLKAAPDGYTTFFGSNTPLSAAPALRKVPPYDPVKDFTAVGLFGHVTFFLFVPAASPSKTLAELIERARANPGKINYGTGNTGSIVATAQLKHLAKLDITHIPYKGDAPTTTDLLGERIHFAFMAPTPALAQAREGRLRMLAVLLPRRSSLAPEVPTIAEAGMPGVTITPWVGMFGPAGVNPGVVARISKDLNAVLARAEIREQIGRQGVEVQATTPAEFAAFTKDQYETWTRVIRETGIPRE
ncbi:MAG: tripartite tricarboxylate transporter substrate binding protein [Betaproteobacteria bacterium]|nr:tripartite tricarboxylate transporter substrate binding protein [Betaproteobacteria bacterium]